MSRSGWVDPFGNPAAKLARVYSVVHEPAQSFLHARYDGTAAPRLPAMHYGKAFERGPVPLSQVRALRWQWRALQHPNIGKDAWVDCAASIYVIIRQPSLFHGGRGFKFGWLASHGAAGTSKWQHGIVQIEQRSEPATQGVALRERRSLRLYKQGVQRALRRGEGPLHSGVMTDGDNTRLPSPRRRLQRFPAGDGRPGGS